MFFVQRRLSYKASSIELFVACLQFASTPCQVLNSLAGVTGETSDHTKSSDLLCAHDCFTISQTLLLLLHPTSVASFIFAVTVRSFILHPVEGLSLFLSAGIGTINVYSLSRTHLFCC